MEKLELNWIGKHSNTICPEPRILIENDKYSYRTKQQGQMSLAEGNAMYGNMLIHGDNLLALKSLEIEFSGKVKCIYIDPPYNSLRTWLLPNIGSAKPCSV